MVFTRIKMINRMAYIFIYPRSYPFNFSMAEWDPVRPALSIILSCVMRLNGACQLLTCCDMGRSPLFVFGLHSVFK